jgi:hypothetical protein
VPRWSEKLKSECSNEEELKDRLHQKMKLASHKWDHREQ